MHGESGIYLIIGQTSLDFEVRPSQGAETGAFGPRSVALVEQAVSHAALDGVHSFDGASDRNLEHDIGPAWTDLTRNTASTSLDLVASVYDPSRQELRISVPRVYPMAARGEWVLNLDRTRENEGVPAWTTTDRDIAFYMIWSGNEPAAGNHGRLFTMPSTFGVVFEENVGATANSSNITAEYEGPTLALGLHRARVLGSYIEYEPHAGAFSWDVRIDGISQGVQAVNISGGVSPYGTAISYGTASRTYGGAARKTTPFIPQPLGADGHTVLVKTTYTGQERFRQFTYSHLVLPEVQPRGL